MALTVPHVKMTLELPTKSGIPADKPQISLYWRPPGGEIPVDGGSGTIIIDALAAAMEQWLTTAAPPSTDSMQNLLGPTIARAGAIALMKLYAIAKDRVQVLGPPFSVRNLAMTGVPPTDGLPSEVAACLTYFADLTGVPERGPNNTRPASSRRGRFYWGPLGTAHVVDPATGVVSIGAPGRNIMLDSARTYLFGQASAASWRWVVFSKTLWEVFDVAGCAVDDAFDTQRRRGEKPTVRVKSIF